MEFSSHKINKFLIFSQKKPFLYFWQRNETKKQDKKTSYISELYSKLEN